jgi:hypothetical protein
LSFPRRDFWSFSPNAVYLGVIASQDFVGRETEITGVDAKEAAYLDIAALKDGEIPLFQRLQKTGPNMGGLRRFP